MTEEIKKNEELPKKEVQIKINDTSSTDSKSSFIRENWSKDFDREQHNRTVDYLFKVKKELGFG